MRSQSLLYDYRKTVFLSVTILTCFIFQPASAEINNSFCSTVCINGSCTEQCSNSGVNCSTSCINGSCTQDCSNSGSQVVTDSGIFTGSGNLETRAMPLSGFTAAYVDNAEFSIVQGDHYQVDITADDNLFDRLNINADNGVLTIAKKSGSYADTTLKAAIHMPNLTSHNG